MSSASPGFVLLVVLLGVSALVIMAAGVALGSFWIVERIARCVERRRYHRWSKGLREWLKRQ